MFPSKKEKMNSVQILSRNGLNGFTISKSDDQNVGICSKTAAIRKRLLLMKDSGRMV